MQNALAIFLPSGVALLIAVGTGLWQDRRQRSERERRVKEQTEHLLQEKAEQYCLSARTISARLVEYVTMLSIAKVDWFRESTLRLSEELNIILLLESFQLAFLKETLGSLGIELKQLLKSFGDFAELMQSYKDEEIPQLIKNGVLSTHFEDLRRLVDQKRSVMTNRLERIPNLDLYKLYTEWRKKHPIE